MWKCCLGFVGSLSESLHLLSFVSFLFQDLANIGPAYDNQKQNNAVSTSGNLNGKFFNETFYGFFSSVFGAELHFPSPADVQLCQWVCSSQTHCELRFCVVLSKHTQPVSLSLCFSPHSETCKEPGEVFVIHFLKLPACILLLFHFYGMTAVLRALPHSLRLILVIVLYRKLKS